MRATIRQYNAMQVVLNEDQFGPLDNDSVIIVIQVICTMCAYRVDLFMINIHFRVDPTGSLPNHVPSPFNYKPSTSTQHRAELADLLARFLRRGDK